MAQDCISEYCLAVFLKLSKHFYGNNSNNIDTVYLENQILWNLFIWSMKYIAYGDVYASARCIVY